MTRIGVCQSDCSGASAGGDTTTDPAKSMRDERGEGTDRRSRILEGARDAFLRFGFERSSMADIAKGAGVTRTALYHYFPGKNEVLQALIKALHESTHRSAIEALEGSADLSSALHGLLQAKLGQALTLMNESPNGIELVEATHRLTGPLTRAADAEFQALVVDALQLHGRAADAETSADTLIAAAKGLMRSGEAHAAKALFDERLSRLLGWLSA